MKIFVVYVLSDLKLLACSIAATFGSELKVTNPDNIESYRL